MRIEINSSITHCSSRRRRHVTHVEYLRIKQLHAYGIVAVD